MQELPSEEGFVGDRDLDGTFSVPGGQSLKWVLGVGWGELGGGQSWAQRSPPPRRLTGSLTCGASGRISEPRGNRGSEPRRCAGSVHPQQALPLGPLFT